VERFSAPLDSSHSHLPIPKCSINTVTFHLAANSPTPYGSACFGEKKYFALLSFELRFGNKNVDKLIFFFPDEAFLSLMWLFYLLTYLIMFFIGTRAKRYEIKPLYS
jgi:hypothetical protein